MKPQCAEITEQKDEGEEVTSAPPGAPMKPRAPPTFAQLDTISRNLDPLLAQCAVIMGDPDQTEALTEFAEGKLSYAEMRARCG